MQGMRKHAHLVAGYHNRQLSHPGDALSAFTGALTSLQNEMNTEFILGLPELNLFEDSLRRSPIHNPYLR